MQGAQRAPQVSGLPFEAHAPPQAWYPLVQATPQFIPSQVAVPWGSAGQGEHEAPQPSTDVFEMQLPVHSWVPGRQTHALPAHPTVPPEGHWTQLVPQKRKPALHEEPQTAPSHVA